MQAKARKSEFAGANQLAFPKKNGRRNPELSEGEVIPAPRLQYWDA
jgi:hypothetical protein